MKRHLVKIMWSKSYDCKGGFWYTETTRIYSPDTAVNNGAFFVFDNPNRIHIRMLTKHNSKNSYLLKMARSQITKEVRKEYIFIVCRNQTQSIRATAKYLGRK